MPTRASGPDRFANADSIHKARVRQLPTLQYFCAARAFHLP